MLAECVSPAHLPHSKTDKRYAICNAIYETSRKIVKQGAKNFITGKSCSAQIEGKIEWRDTRNNSNENCGKLIALKFMFRN